MKHPRDQRTGVRAADRHASWREVAELLHVPDAHDVEEADKR